MFSHEFKDGFDSYIACSSHSSQTLFYILLSLRFVEGTSVCHLSPDQPPTFHGRSQDQTQTLEHAKQALHRKPSFRALCSGFSNLRFANLIPWGCLDVPLWIGCFLMNFCCICTVGGRFLHGACHLPWQMLLRLWLTWPPIALVQHPISPGTLLDRDSLFFESS